MLKLYVQDNSEYGMIVVVSTSLLQARELMKQHYNYDPKQYIEEHEIKEKLCVVNYGDFK